jgi:DNA-binding MarR family transcriptional regulator
MLGVHVGASRRRITWVSDRLPDSRELAAWREFLRAHSRLTRMLEAELVTDAQLSLAAYDVLVQLAEAPCRRLRMTDLADALLLSRSGVTRLVDRLERIDLVERSRAAGDGRGVVAGLTERGLARLRAASDVHLAGISRHFATRLDGGELVALQALCARLAGPPVTPSRPAEPASSDPGSAPDRSEPDPVRVARTAATARNAGSRG